MTEIIFHPFRCRFRKADGSFGIFFQTTLIVFPSILITSPSVRSDMSFIQERKACSNSSGSNALCISLPVDLLSL
jgi:hypothetical protein